MESEEAVLKYLIEHGPQTTFRLASALGIERGRIVSILDKLAEERVVEFERGIAKALRKKLLTAKPRKIELKPKKEIKKKLRPKPKKQKVKTVKKKVTEEVPRIVRSVIKEVIPEEKLTELETRIKEKVKAFVEEAKRAVTSDTEKLIVELDLPVKLKQFEEKISELEARLLAKSKIIRKVKIPEELKEKIEEIAKKLEAILRVKKAREEEVEKIKPKPLPKPEKPRKLRLKLLELLKLKALKIPKIKIRIPKIKLPKLKIKSKPEIKKAKAEKIKKKKGKGVFTKIGRIGKTKFLSEEI